MRSLFLCLAALALTSSACTCGQRLSSLSPSLVVTVPSTRTIAGDEWLLDFGGVQTGASASRQIVIENQGNGDGTLTSIKLRDGSDPGFSLQGDETPKGIASGKAQTITVVYAPTVAGAAAGVVDIKTTDPKAATITVRLVATAQAAAVEVCVESASGGAWECSSEEGASLVIDFGALLIGSPAERRAVRVRNVGSAPLSYFGTALIDPTSPLFTLDPWQDLPAGGSPLASAGELVFNVVFNPAAEGALAGTAEVTTADATTPVVNIQLKATAAASLVCKVRVAPSRVDFGNVIAGSASEQGMTITNAGTQPCTVSGVPLSGSTAFTLVGAPNIPAALVPGAVAVFKVRYQPTGASSDLGTLTVSSDDPASPSIAVPLTGSGISTPDCVLTATPASLNFGGVIPGDRSIMSVALAATGSEPCNVTSVKIRNANPNFRATMQTPLMIFPAGGLGGFGAGSVGVTYAPASAGTDSDTLVINYSVGLFGGGPALSLSVPLNGRSGAKRLCVAPTHLHFGAVPPSTTKPLPFTMTACGNAAVNVTAMTIENGGPPFTLSPAPTLPIALPRSASASQVVLASPTSSNPASARVHVVSDDPVFPDLYVTLDIGQELAPADAGEVLYSWTAGAFGGGAMDGTIYRTYLQGPPNRTAYYGSQAGQQCAGCHAASPDGRYIALIEYGSGATMRVVDARTGGSLPIPNTSNGQFPSWRPNVTTTPPYQFVYNDGNVLKIASLTAGVIGQVQGANDPAFVQTQPSWGPNGTIAFVRGSPEDAGTFSISGPADLMTVPESGGTATAVAGASANGGGNYYPEYSPNGKYIAYTFSPSGKTTRSAPDSVIRLVEVGTGQIKNLPQLNAATPNSWPTWSKDGTFLSFSSERSGGKGSSDVYMAPVNQSTGVDGPATPISVINTANYDHVARWAFLPP